MTDTTGKLAGWRLGLSDYDFKVVDRTDVTHQAADALSRLHMTRMDKSQLEDYLPVLKITDTHAEGEKFETDAIIWHSLPK